MNTIALEGTKRAELGKKATKAVRKAGNVPCIIYGGSETVAFEANKKSFTPIVYTPNFYIVEIAVDGANHKCILKDIQFHPVTDEIQHVDFLELSDDKKVIVDLPLVFEGLSAGVREGGKQLAQMRKLRVKAFPKDLIPELKVDVTNLELGRSIKVQEVSYPNLEILNSMSNPMVSVEIPRALKSAEAAAEGEGAEATEEGAEAAAE